MSNQPYFEEQKEDIKEHHKNGYRRIEEWYTTPKPVQERHQSLKEAPHKILLVRAGSFVKCALRFRQDTQETMEEGPGSREYHDILLAIGTELLLNAAILKTDHDYYFDKSSPEQTINFTDAREKLCSIVQPDLTEDQMRRLNLVLDIIKLHRDEAVHFGIYKTDHPAPAIESYNVLIYLFNRFGEEQRDVIEQLNQQHEKDQRTHGDMPYKQVEFPSPE